LQENEANIKAVAAKLRASIEALCDKLKDNPNVAENMAKVASERQGLQGLLAKALEELLAMRKIPCVTEAVLAEHYRRKEVKDVVEREKTAARAVATLRMELRDERDDHEQARGTLR
jgi:flagellar biosynthesis component FlhA